MRGSQVPVNIRDNRVSIIVLNWNGGDLLQTCLEAARTQSHGDFELILVDNGSTDGSFEQALQTGWLDKVVRHEKNAGYAAGMNAGIAQSTGGYILPLGYDVALSRDYVAQCCEAMRHDGGIGAAGGTEFDWRDGEMLSERRPSAGALYLQKSLRGTWEGHGEPVYAFGVSGSMPLLRRAMLDDVHWLHGYWYDERFGTGYEDVDLWFRMQWARLAGDVCPPRRGLACGFGGGRRRDWVSFQTGGLPAQAVPQPAAQLCKERHRAIARDVGFFLFSLRDDAAGLPAGAQAGCAGTMVGRST